MVKVQEFLTIFVLFPNIISYNNAMKLLLCLFISKKLYFGHEFGTQQILGKMGHSNVSCPYHFEHL